MLTNSSEIELLRRPKDHRDYLVFVRSGCDAVFLNQGVPQQRNWDLCVSLYTREEPQTLITNADWLIQGGLSKWHSLRLFLEQNAPKLMGYKAFWVVDDDIMLPNPEMINEMFDIFVGSNIYIGQPSLTADSHSTFRLFLSCPGFVFRYTNFVECMMPIFSGRALYELCDTFSKSISGYGIDIMWSRQAHRLNRLLVVMDVFRVAHSRAVGSGGFYRYLASIGIDPVAELGACLQAECISEFRPQTVGGVILPDSISLRRVESFCTP